MDVFELRGRVVGDYAEYVSSFLSIQDGRIRELVAKELAGGLLWPDPLIQLNPSFEAGESLDQLIEGGELHGECLKIFARKKKDGSGAVPLSLHRHQVEAIRAARAGESYVLTTGTGSGKSLSYIVPIVDHVLRRGSGRGIQAVVVYPMNALANSQLLELEKFLEWGYSKPPVTFARYTGQEDDVRRQEICAQPPDILLTNYMMLELVLTRQREHTLIDAASNLRFLVLDELHTYRGRQGADVAMLVRRVRERCGKGGLLTIGTSATLASSGTWRAQQEEVAAMATDLFGATIKPELIIGETLRRVTPAGESPAELHRRVADAISRDDVPPPNDFARFVTHPLSIWIESNLGLEEELGTKRLVRARPTTLTGPKGAVAALARATGLPPEPCEAALRKTLLAGFRVKDAKDQPAFAFRLHQFVSKGESVHASPEEEAKRELTLRPQLYVPGADRKRVYLPLAFCRECGEEYYVVRRTLDEDGLVRYVPRELSDRVESDEGIAGYLHVSTEDPWPPPDDPTLLERLPENWLDRSGGRTTIKRNMRERVPRPVDVAPDGTEGTGGLRAHWFEAPFLFCMRCEVTYNARQTSDFGKLATLGSEGRSTATTVMSLSTVRQLKRDETLEREARKLLSFTDNRQDASLQSGHFNDFVEIALLRSALWRAAQTSGAEGLRHDELTRMVFDALGLPIELYAMNPMVEYHQREETDRALRQALGYYLYRDLQRGWRITSPNLEQSGLLDIRYLSLDRFCADEPRWSKLHPLLATATPAVRERVCQALLDFLRRELAIRVDFLDPVAQEGLKQLSSQYLVAPWSLEEQEQFERSRIVFPRSRDEGDERFQHFVFLSPLGGFGSFLKRRDVFPGYAGALKTPDVEQVIAELLKALTIPDLVREVSQARDKGDVPGYQLNASALLWRAGKGDRAFHDPIRVPKTPEGGLRTNPFFTRFYRQPTEDLRTLHAREHTAQVPDEKRREREEAFRDARLPILYCSPTMELGVDIKQLNTVNLRNVPPTPANYAQRSGRAGRSGQPAFVFTYCSAGSPHDQYYFKRPDQMVAGAVTTPRIDLENDDLLRAHVHAVWLAVSHLDLGSSLSHVLDASGPEPTLELLPSIRSTLGNLRFRVEAKERALAALGPALRTALKTEGEVDPWLDRVLLELPQSFERACGRWRDLYRAALAQSKRQSQIALDASRPPNDRETARRLRAEAEAQLGLLLETEGSQHSDFNSYRYFACEGFLPGYNFPRLPLSAYLPGRRRRAQFDEFLTRPRFLAISEFGPRSIIYHEGSRYVVNKAILPYDAPNAALTRRASQCEACGYLHPLGSDPGPDRCERCEALLTKTMDNLFRMHNVSTRRKSRINSDEEERLRMGYEIKTGVRFATRGNVVSVQHAKLVTGGGTPLATFFYGRAATLWRMNLGLRRRKKDAEVGYVLDIERGYWARQQAQENDQDGDDPMSPRIKRVIPYVEDHRNCLLIEPADTLEVNTATSLEAVLKAAIQSRFQLEDRELATEPLPSAKDRRSLLLYEASEGGAGVLRRLVDDPALIPEVARAALERAHYDPQTGADTAADRCESACYDCLLSYFNQRDHRRLDRRTLPELLRSWSEGQVQTSPAPAPRGEHLDRLMRLADSELEREWLTRVDHLGLKLPSDGQVLVAEARARADFRYGTEGVLVFVDGPHHRDGHQQADDRRQQDALEAMGFTVVRFTEREGWDAVFLRYPSVFGEPEVLVGTGVPPTPEPSAFDPQDYDAAWLPSLERLTRAGYRVSAGEEVMRKGKVVDLDLATAARDGKAVRLIDERGESAAVLAEALREQGYRVAAVKPDPAEVLARVNQAYEAP